MKNLTFGGLMTGRGVVADGTSEGRYVRTNFRAWKLKSREPARTHKLKVFLHTDQAKTVEAWRAGLDKLAGTASSSDNRAREKNLAWWQQFWQRSHLRINCDRPDRQDKAWQVGRNYHLFRYMLGCNAYSEYPTKFNGGTLTYDPQFVGGRYAWIADADETPDYRGWGGGSFTAQNQRLVYFPMLKTGDFDLMITQFEFYRRALSNAEARVRVYWGHDGCCFTEQMNQYGLPVGSHYGWVDATGYRSRPADLEDGVQVNGAVGYLYESQLEFSWMVLKYYEYTGKDISAYMPFIESSVTFYDRHYQYRCKQLTGKPLDENGHLVIYPSAAMEGYKGCRNPASVIAGLHAVLSSMLELPDWYAPAAKKQAWRAMLERVPPLPVKTKDGHRTIQPAQSHAHRGGHLPELYPLYPYERYGLGKPDLEVAVNTWRYGLTEQARTAYISWHQGNIFAARLGLTDEAAALSIKKLEDSGRRFPAFWGPGHDYVPDHNWGGSGMIGLQEMLMQAFARKIYLLPAWPKGWDVDFKLHAPYKTVVEGVLRNGKIESLKVTPEDRREDIEVMEPR